MQWGNLTVWPVNRTDKRGTTVPTGFSPAGLGVYLSVVLLVAGCEFDNQTPGIVVSPSSGLVTTENGDSDQFSISLDAKPDAMVNIAISSSNTNEGQLSTNQVSFGPANWSTPKAISVFGVDDSVADGDTQYSIVFSRTESADQRYNNLSIASISAVNQDNELSPPPKPSAGVTVTPTTAVDSPLTTSENGTSVTVSVVLNSQPASNVTIAANSSNANEGAVNPPSITFTTDNWDSAQEFTVSGVDDNTVDGTIAYTVTLSAQSNDPQYHQIAIVPVQLQNMDNDAPPQTGGISVNPSTGLVTSENRTSASLSVVLTAAPTADVTIDLSSSDISEGLPAPATLTFTPSNWNTAQTVTVTGVDDAVVDGDVNYTINFDVQSADSAFNNLTVQSVSAVNQDNDTAAPAGVTVSPRTGLATSEDLSTDSFTVVLDSQPAANVAIALNSSNTSEATVSPGNLSFTTSNWNTPQTVTLTGVDDAIVDGAVSYQISFAVQSSDTDYNNLTVQPVSAVNQDNDTAPPAGVTVTPRTGLETSEDLTTDTFTVVLDSQPAANVAISLNSSNTSEATVSPGNLSFTTSNWNIPQTVTLTGVDDTIVDGAVSYQISFTVQSSDSGYNNLVLQAVSAVNLDNDSAPQAGVTVAPRTGLTTSEDLTTDTFTIVLNSQPAGDVTVSLTSSDSGEATVSPASLTFTAGNWNAPQTVTLTGVDDPMVDVDTPYTVSFSVQSSDTNYNNLTVPPVNAINQDNDTADITLLPVSGLLTSEDLTSDTFTAVLTSQPADNVSITLTSSEPGEATVTPASLTFTATNWDTAQSVTLTGVDDDIVDGDVSYTISFAVQSSDSNYNNLAVAAINGVNQDNDTAGIDLVPSAGLVTSEDLTSDTFTAVLTSQPQSAVTITLASSNTLEGTVSPGTLTFDAGNWDILQTVTVSGVDDTVVDGDVNYTITSTVQSTDSNYNNLALTAVSATNLDNDTPPPPPNNYVLYIEPAVIDIAPSTVSGNGATQLNAMGYSLTATPQGQTPGPVIEAVVGQTTTVEVVNDHINTHHFEIEGLLTGTPALPPGGSLVFQFTPTEAGVYRYGDPELLRRALGLQGAVVVRPASNPNTAWSGGPVFDQERTWVVSDFDQTWLASPSTVDTTQYNPNYFLMNGKSGFAAKQDPASTIDGNVGETFLIRIVNAGQYDQSLHFHSNHFQIISEGGFKYTNLATAPVVTTINVKRASTAMVLFTLTQTGTYPVHVHSAQMETGNGVYLNGTATYIIGR